MATSPSENSVLVSASKSKVLSLSGDLTGDFVGDLVGDLFGGCWCDDAAASGVPVGRRPAGAWVGITLSPLTGLPSSAGLTLILYPEKEVGNQVRAEAACFGVL